MSSYLQTIELLPGTMRNYRQFFWFLIFGIVFRIENGETTNAVVQPQNTSQASSTPSTISELEISSETDASSKPEVTSWQNSISEPVSTSEPEYYATPESEVLSEPANASVTSNPDGITEPELYVTSEPKSASEPGALSETKATSEPRVFSEPENYSEPEATSEPESISEPETSSDPKYHGTPESEPEPENTDVTSDPEGISEPELKATSEPKTVSEPDASTELKTTSEPGVLSESEFFSKPEATSEPEYISEPDTSSDPIYHGTPESEATSEPENTDVTAEPESISEPEHGVTSEPNSVSEPEASSEPENYSEPKATSEPKSVLELEISSEPELYVAPESGVTSEPEISSEPETNAKSEETPEPGLVSEPDTSSEPEVRGTLEPEVMSEPTSYEEPVGPAEHEPIPESPDMAKSEDTAKPEAEAETRPSTIEIVLPPIALLALVIIALLILLIATHCKRWISACNRKRKLKDGKISNSKLKIVNLEYASSDSGIDEDEEFLSDFDCEVLHSLIASYNRPMELFRIALPAMLSLALCPLTLYMYVPFTEFIWPPEEYAVAPNINDAIACFLAPAGLVYATSFGFAFQQALSKQHHILTKVTGEISMVDQIATFATRLSFKMPQIRREIYKAVKAEAIFMVLQILNREPQSYVNQPQEDVKVKIWSVVDMLRAVDTSDRNTVDKLLCEKILSHIMKLNSICSDRIGVLHTKIHPVKWAFLETLGFFSFIGILLLRAYSYRMELVMCILTVFSISMLCYVVSDLDSPFSGFFRVDLSVLVHVVEKLESMYKDAKFEDNQLSDDRDDNITTTTTCISIIPERNDTAIGTDEKGKLWAYARGSVMKNDRH